MKEFPHAVAKKVFCFGYSFGATPTTGVEGGRGGEGGNEEEKESFETHYRNKEELVIFPPEGDHVDSGMSLVELHMGVMLNDIAVVILLHLEEEVSRTKAGGGTSSSSNAGGGKLGSGGGTSSSSSSSSGGGGGGGGKTLAKRGGHWLAGFRSPFDDDPSPTAVTTKTTTSASSSSSGGGGSSSSVPIGIDGSHGRVNKWVGDICLLAGTPQDALEAYTLALAECKAVGEGLWQAGAVEGWMAAVEVMQSWGMSLEEYLPGGGGGREGGKGGGAEGGGKKQQELVGKELEEKGGEALSLLELGGAAHASLAVALCFKVARVQGGREGGRDGRCVEAWEWVMRAMGLEGLGMVCRWEGGREGGRGGREGGGEGGEAR